MVELSIIIVSRNVKDFLRRCILSIYQNPPRASFEVLVVDNNSNDGSSDMIKDEFPGVDLIENKENYGFARANNQALRRCRGRFILLLNPDTEVLPGTLNKLIDFMNLYPPAGALGCKIVNALNRLQPSCRSFPTLLTEFWRSTALDTLWPKNRIIGRYYMSYWNHNDIREVDQPIGACLMVRREAMEEVGLLDELFFLYFEDVDWCYRIKKGGWKIYFTPDAAIIHHGGQSTRQEQLDVLVERHKSLYRFFRKHYGKYSVCILKGILLLGFLVKILRSLINSIKNYRKSAVEKSRIELDLKVLLRSWCY